MADSAVGAGGRGAASASVSASPGLGEVGVSVGAGPLVPAGGGAVVGQGGECFQPVMSSAEAGERLGVGLSGWSALVERYVGGDVVEVAVAGGDPAGGGNAVVVAEDDVFPHDGWWVVGVAGPVCVEVQHRPDR